MLYKTKQSKRIVAGVLLAATLLAIPVTSAVLGDDIDTAQPHLTQDEPADEEPHIGSDIDSELLIFDNDGIDRGVDTLAGIDDEADAKDTPSLDPSKERELIERLEQAEAKRLSEKTKREAAAALEREQKEKEEKKAAEQRAKSQKAAAAPKNTAPAVKETESTSEAPEAPTTEDSSPTGGGFLLAISNPDPRYTGRTLQVADRAALEGLVMGEWGNDYIGAVLVAQCIRDSMVKEGTNSAMVIKRKYGYTAPVRKTVSSTVKQAVAYVFDEGGSGVQHPIYYFYASNLVRGKWHETQKFIVQHKAVRFFSPHR